MRGLDAVVVNIGGGVADGDGAVLAVTDVLLHVTSHGLDVRGGGGCGDAVDDLVAGEEEQGVAVFLKLVDRGEYALQIFGIIGIGGRVLVEGVFGGVDVQREVDSSLCQGVHACVVVFAVVDRVHTYGIDLELLEPVTIRIIT